MKHKVAYVDYYSEHEISPVSQDIDDIDKHFERRTSLYKDLGLPPAFIGKSKILEVGPGSGYNSIHLAQFKPLKYTLIEPNKFGRAEVNNLFKKYVTEYTDYELFDSFIQDFSSSELYDIVIGEGFLGFLANAEEVLGTMGNFVSPGGVLCFTTSDSVSYFADLLKRIIGVLLIDPASSYENQLGTIVPVLSRLMSVDGMSRPIKDWVADNVIHPMEKNYVFSIADAIETVNSDFVFYNSSSPNFKTDWRWYKQQCNQGDSYNDFAKKQYYENVHNFLDYRFVHTSRPKGENTELLNLCESVFTDLKKFEANRENTHIEDIITTVDVLQRVLKKMKLSEKTVASIDDFKVSVEKIMNGETNLTFDSFAKFSGRGQQYVSFLKKSPPFMR